MSKTEELKALVDALASERWLEQRDAVHELAHRIRARELGARALETVCRRLVALAAHPKWEVRKAVADSLPHLPEETFHQTVAALLDDSNSWVRDGARQALARRTRLTRVDLLRERHGDVLLGWLDELEAQHGTRAREAALRLAERTKDLIVRELYHEVVKILAPLDLSLTNLDSELRRRRLRRDKCRDHVTRARERARLVGAIVDTLRQLTADTPREFRAENLRELLAEAATLVRDRRGFTRKELRVDLEVDAGIVVEGLRHRLLQAFTNVLMNAVEAYDGLDGRRRLTVTAELEQGEGRVTVRFEDHGCGMCAEAVRDAFQLFTSGKPSGLGLGLPLARKVVESEHRGSIELASEKGIGTTVTVVLPLEQEPV